MQLTDTEQRFLDGDYGQAARTAMEILVALGEIYGADCLLPVRSVQIAGVSYHNLGEAGLEFLEELARDGRALVPTSLNPAGMDLERHREMGIGADFAASQLRIIEAFRRMQVATTLTCTPYHIGMTPGPGDTLAWSESSAVTYANSVLGARTNREGGPSALAAALCGCTPRYGLHLTAERASTLQVVVDTALAGPSEWGLLGAAIGQQRPGALPLIVARSTPDVVALKALAAALPTFGGQPMFHLVDVTPEAGQQKLPADQLTVNAALLDATRQQLEAGASDRIDLVTVGCPHASLDELTQLAQLLGDSQVAVPLWISTAPGVRDQARARGLVETIEHSGARVWAGTCFAVAPLKGRFTQVVTNSAKGCYYGAGHNLFRMRLASVEQCVQAALTGCWDGGSR